MTLEHLHYWCHKVLPLTYDNSLSYYEVLCKLTDYIQTLVSGDSGDEGLVEVIKELGTTVEELQQDITDINTELEKIKSGQYVDLYLKAMEDWINNNLSTIVSGAVHMIFFGLDMDGHFCAYIPDNWNFINFDTVVNPESPLDGHLVLRW